MKKVLIAILSFLLPAILTAQIRNYVGIVREQYNPELVNFLQDFKKDLNNNGYSFYANSIDSYLKGSFGSGFIYVDANGNNYIITNNHVVSQAETASIEFEDVNTDTIIKYEGLSVVAIDEDIDIAILKFADDSKHFADGLKISDAALTDGQDVWSAGFPGLGGNPVWQLGKGTVTNSRAKIKELLDPSISSLIQHSAEVDGGNSGGPLLIQADNSTGYEVVGINTWKAVFRQNTNFAIPAGLINTMIEKANKTNEIFDLNVVQARSKNLIEILNNKDENFTSLVKYISDEITLERGKDDFIAAVRYAYSNDREIIAEAFNYSPIEGLRYSVAYQLWKKYSSKVNDDKTLAENYFEVKDSFFSAKYVFDEDDKNIAVVWENEKGIWRIKSFETEGEKIKKSEKAKSKLEKGNPGAKGLNIDTSSILSLNLGAGMNLNNKFDFSSISVGLNSWIFDYSGINFSYIKLFPGKDYSKNVFSSGLSLRLPVEINEFLLVEAVGKANLAFSMSFGSEIENTMGYMLEGGVNFMKNDTESAKSGFGISYSILNLKEPFTDDYMIKMRELKIYGVFAL